jgi:indoleamine 2,3-dioxygenase
MYMHDIFPSFPEVFRQLLSIWKSTLGSYAYGASSPETEIDFDINHETGFFPAEPLQRLLEPYDLWERKLSTASEVLTLGEYDDEETQNLLEVGKQWRDDIRKVRTPLSISERQRLMMAKWPVLSTESLYSDTRNLKRAHLVLAWLTHFFVHSIPAGSDESPTLVPRALAVPLVEVSRALGMAPVLTYADSILWNWDRIHPDQPTTIDNVEYTNLFSGTEEERGFYMVFARAEMEGAKILDIIEESITSSSHTDFIFAAKISRDLKRLEGIIDELHAITQSIRDICDPHVFYWAIRPWFDGSGSGTMRERWQYEGVEDSDELLLCGPSGGQSGIIHALDLFLDVDHKRHEQCAGSTNGRGFMEQMRQYMPRQHREYLASIQSIREKAQQMSMLHEPYNSAMLALKKLREAHMGIALLYIVTASKSDPSGRPGCPMIKNMLNDRGSIGTGGTELRALLKSTRDATRRSLLSPRKV